MSELEKRTDSLPAAPALSEGYQEAKQTALERGESVLGRALGQDDFLIAKWVTHHERVCECAAGDFGWTQRCGNCFGRNPVAPGYGISAIANHVGVGDAKAAIAMKYARKDGLAEKVEHDTLGTLFVPTEKALEAFPPGEPHVVLENEPVELGSGTFQSVRGEDIRRMTDDQLPGVARRQLEDQDGLTRRGLPPGGDDEDEG